MGLETKNYGITGQQLWCYTVAVERREGGVLIIRQSLHEETLVYVLLQCNNSIATV
jgi:hypothetical protein